MEVSIFGKALQILFSTLIGLIFSIALWFAAIIAWLITVILNLIIVSDHVPLIFTLTYIIILVISPFFPIRFWLKTYSGSRTLQQAWVAVVDSVVETIQRSEKAQADIKRYMESTKPELKLDDEEFAKDKNGNYQVPSFNDTYGIVLKLILVILFIGVTLTCVILIFTHLVREWDFKHLDKKSIKTIIFIISSIGSILFMLLKPENFVTLMDKVGFFTSTSIFPSGLLDYFWD